MALTEKGSTIYNELSTEVGRIRWSTIDEFGQFIPPVSYSSSLSDETVTLVDSMVRFPKKVADESLTLVDSMVRFSKKVADDSLTLVDSLVKLSKRELTDSLTLVDSLVRLSKKVVTDSLTLVDSIVREFAQNGYKTLEFVKTIRTIVFRRTL